MFKIIALDRYFHKRHLILIDFEVGFGVKYHDVYTLF